MPLFLAGSGLVKRLHPVEKDKVLRLKTIPISQVGDTWHYLEMISRKMETMNCNGTNFIFTLSDCSFTSMLTKSNFNEANRSGTLKISAISLTGTLKISAISSLQYKSFIVPSG